MNQQEEWRDVLGYGGKYRISSFGRVLSTGPRNRKGEAWAKLRKVRINNGGYPTINLRRDGRARNVFVHTLILEAFVCPRPAGLEAAHLDGVRAHSVLSNLRWVTRSDNAKHRTLHGTQNKPRLLCKRGHPLVGKNVYLHPTPGKGRDCRACRKEAWLRYSARKSDTGARDPAINYARERNS